MAQLLQVSPTGSLLVFGAPRVTPAQEALWYAIYAAVMWAAVIGNSLAPVPAPQRLLTRPARTPRRLPGENRPRFADQTAQARGPSSRNRWSLRR